MISRKKANILQLLLLLLVLGSCKDNSETKNGENSTVPKDTMPHLEQAVQKQAKLDANFVNRKKNAITHFYNKTWPNNSMNGDLLVAKNGQIIYEKYEGLANFRSERPITATTPLHLASVSKVITATHTISVH